MKNFNFLSSLGRQSSGLGIATLASTVGSPSAHRRGTMLKLISVLMLVLTLGVGQMWATDQTITLTYSSFGLTTSYTKKTAIVSSIGFTVDQGYKGSGNTIQMNSSKGSGILYNTTAISGLKSIKVNVSSGNKTYTITTGTSEKPTANSQTGTTGGTYNAKAGDTYFQLKVSGASYFSSIEITYEEGATLSSVAVSGTPTQTTYENGNAFDATGLTVTGTYSDSSNKTETTGITWTACKTQDGTYVALDNAAVALATNETGIYVKATVSGITSPAFHVTGLTVTAPLPTITITQNEVASFTNSYAQYTWTAGGVSGKMYAYKNSGMQFNSGKDGYYVYNTDPIPGVIRKITMTQASGTARTWTPYVSTTALTSTTGGTSLTAKSVGTAGTSWDVTGSNSYFYLTVSGGSTVISSIVITYEEVKNAVTVATPATGSGTLSVTGAASLSEVLLGTELTVAAAPSATYHGGTVKVIKTGVTPEEDVTSTVYNAGTGKLTMPDYPITVSATFVADAAISVAVATDQSSWGSVKLYNSTPAEVSSGTTFKPSAGFKIEATPASDDYEFVSWAKSNGSDITLSVADAAKSNPTLTAGEVSTTFTATFREKAKPYFEVDPDALSFGPIAVNGSQNKTFKLKGQNLTEDASLAISGTGAAMFSVAASVDKNGDGAIDEDVTVTYNPTATGTHTATLTISSDDAEDVEVALSGEAKVLRTVKWYSSNSTEITGDDLGEATTSVLDGGKVTTLPDDPESCDASISFQGWTNATYAKSDDAPTVLFDDTEDAPAISGDNASYYAVWANGGTKSDELTLSTTGVDAGTTYADWSGKTVNSTAVYAGNSAGDKSSIQLRSNNSTSGVITTTSGGKATKVSVVWQSDTQTDRTLNVYGKNSAYSAASDLYGEATQGTLLGTIVKGTSTELTITGDYEYIGVRSASGAMYLTSLTVQWSKVSDYATTCSAPVEIADPTFSPAAGSYDDDQSVTLGFASPATAVYYTTDGTSDPKTSGTLYSSAISVTEDMTIKAAATDGNGNWSNVVTKTYTINYSSSIAAYIAKAQATTRYLRLNEAQNCVVTAVKKNNQDKVTNIYCQDNSGAGIIIYNGSGFGSNEINVGDRIVGAVSGTYSPYLKQPEMESAAFADGVTFTHVDRPSAPTVSVADVNSGAAYTAHPMMLVTVADLYYKSVSGSAYTFNTQANGEGTDITIYDNFSYLSGKTMPGVACTIVGIMARNNDAYQVLPVELTTAATATLPEIDPEGGADAEHALEVTYLSAVNVPLVENEDIYVSVNDAEATKLTEAASVTIENDTKIAVTAKRDFYADNTVTYFYKPSAYPKNITVTSVHGDVVVKVGEATVSTALPGATVKFTVTPENEHFHIASTSVTYEGGSLTPSLSENVYSFTMPDKDATIVVNYTEDTKYSITFNGGGAAGEGPAAIEDQYAGAEITLPTKEEANYTAPTNKVFNGWLVTSGEEEVEQNNGKFDMPAGNVTITAQWADRIFCALTLNINGSTSTTNIDREVKYVLPTEEDAISGYDFYGWAIAPEVDDVEEAIDTIKSFTPAANEASKTLYAVFKREYVGEDKEDELTAADLAATGTSYADFSNVQKVSNAKYAGNSAKNNAGAIQLRSDKSTAGIVSTVSGGTIKSVKITIASGSNTIDVYGSNTAYAAASDLYGSSKGTKIGSTSSTGTITPTAQQVFKYVGIRSNSGAAYLSSVTITWTPKATYYTTAPAQVYDVEYALGGGAWKENEGCEAAKVKAGQTYTICADEPVRDHYTFAKWQIGGEDASGEITINANTTITAVWTAKVESNVTYNAGTGSGDPVVISTVEEGTEVTLKAIGSGEGQANFAKSGYDFVGWLRGNVLYKAGETFEMPAEAVTLIAQWKKQNVEKLSLVTDASQLLDGMEIVLACKNPVSNNTEKDPAIAGVLLENKYLKSVTTNVTFNNDNTVSYSSEDVITLTLESESEGWALRNGTNYLTPNGKNNQVKWGTSPFVWSISIANGNAYIQQGNYTINYNAAQGTERFSQYTNQQNDIQIYGKATVVSGTTSISQIGYVDGDVIVLSESATLTVDADIAPTTVIVPAGGTVTVKDNKTIDANTVIVENGGTLDIQTNGTVKTNETLIIHSTLGKGTGTTASGNAPGACGQVVNGGNITVSGDVYLEIDLTQDAKASAGWYAFSVPFPVDAMNGVYYKETKLTNEVGYAIMSHDGALRAKDEYAWKKFRGIMQPGVFYVITVGNTDYKTLRFKKVTGEALVASTSVAVSPFPSQTGDNADGAWNGIGNPNLQISNLSTSVTTMQFYDHKTNSFIGRDHSVNLVVGSAFFIQYNTTSSVSIPTEINDGHGYLAPKREQKDIENTIYKVELMNMTTDELEDNVFLTAREDALNEYEIGRDVAKLSMGTAKCAQMYVPAYGTQLCAADFRLINDKAEYPLTLTAPAAGTYSITAPNAENADLYLTYEGAIIWNLSESAYEFDLNKGTTNGYGLLLQKKAPAVVTGVETVTGYGLQVTGVQKIVIDDHVFILRGGQMYDVNGKMVK